MAYPYAVAATIPTADRADGDKLSWALGYQPDPSTGARTFVAALSSDGSEPATHYGYNAQAAAQDFVDILHAAKGGTLVPIDWEAYGLTVF